MDIRGVMTAEICREVGAKAATPVERAMACSPVRRIAVNPGLSVVDDTLPPSLQEASPVLLTYRVQIYNSTGHSAGKSSGAYAAAGSVPPAVELLRATASERGAILEWHPATATADFNADFVDLWRTDLSAPAPEKQPKRASSARARRGKQASKAEMPDQEPELVHLRTAEAESGSPGTVDATAMMGQTYSYVAERVRRVTIENKVLELRSAPSAAVTLTMRDTFPPKIPVGLAAVSGFDKPETGDSRTSALPYVDLSWEANGEPDLAGYRVYRQLARPDGTPQGPLARLTASPLTSPAYRDVAVKPGQGYIYTVTAVDVAGNESAPSAKALEVVSSDNGGSSSLLSPYSGELIAVRWDSADGRWFDISARRHNSDFNNLGSER